MGNASVLSLHAILVSIGRYFFFCFIFISPSIIPSLVNTWIKSCMCGRPNLHQFISTVSSFEMMPTGLTAEHWRHVYFGLYNGARALISKMGRTLVGR